MTDKRKGQPEKPAEETDLPGSGEWVPLQEGRYGASWFVMLIGLTLVAFYYYSMIIENVIVIKKVTEPPTYGGPSDWVASMAPWLSSNAFVIVLGSIFFLIGYSLTLRRKADAPRSQLLLHLFSVCSGFSALALLAIGIWYSFFLPKELSGFIEKLDFYGLQFTSFLLWGGILAAITVYCWLKKEY